MIATKTTPIMRATEGKAMFWRLRKRKISVLDEPIASVLDEMNSYGADSPEFAKMLKHLETLIELKSDEHKKKISADTMMIVAGNLLGILIIVVYEQKHVMVSKAMGFILKPKS